MPGVLSIQTETGNDDILQNWMHVGTTKPTVGTPGFAPARRKPIHRNAPSRCSALRVHEKFPSQRRYLRAAVARAGA